MPFENGKLVTYAREEDPLTTPRVFELLDFLRDEEELDNFMNTKDYDLIDYHHSLGQHIRNHYLWKDYDQETSELHPDDVSFKMIQSLHGLLHILKDDGIDLHTFKRDSDG